MSHSCLTCARSVPSFQALLPAQPFHAVNPQSNSLVSDPTFKLPSACTHLSLHHCTHREADSHSTEGRGGSGRMCPQEVPTQRDRPLEGQLYVQPETESESCWVVSDSLRPHGLYSPWNSPGQKTAVGSLPFSRDLLNPGIKPRYQLSHKGSPRILEWVAIPFSRGSS